ncbi:Diacylglycerol kinase eta [Folsomia candida]|uniref:Diacylglycerol kinase eta n=1 Tax=Folsomia candida TaxID=158441 RepID=A0A226CVZ8_FOLCA|nr:Diacylglycerol kinase eta [Folsomia candida]
MEEVTNNMVMMNGNGVGMSQNLNNNKTCEKEGYLMKQTSSFQRWHKRYFKILGKKLLYGKDEKSQIFEEVDLSEVTIAESSSKSCKNSFQDSLSQRMMDRLPSTQSRPGR